jgi:hypothetical protein
MKWALIKLAPITDNSKGLFGKIYFSLNYIRKILIPPPMFLFHPPWKAKKKSENRFRIFFSRVNFSKMFSEFFLVEKETFGVG